MGVGYCYIFDICIAQVILKKRSFSRSEIGKVGLGGVRLEKRKLEKWEVWKNEFEEIITENRKLS